jgi:ubiquinone/menaquinone biosynthesis C-methylase UbiE
MALSGQTPSRGAATDGATAEWRRIARNEDVLYSVAGWPEKRGGAWTEADFYASGASDWRDFEHHWSHYDRDLGGTCVEIGCGPGRITHALADRFDRVVALDVADEMLARARAASPAAVEFERVDGPRIPLADNEADAVFSCHVLQHLETPAAVRAYLAEARRVLRAGGTLMVHLTITSRHRSRLWRLREELRLWVSRRRLRRGESHTAVRMQVYLAEDVLALLDSLGFSEVEMRAFRVRSNSYLHHFFLARA